MPVSLSSSSSSEGDDEERKQTKATYTTNKKQPFPRPRKGCASPFSSTSSSASEKVMAQHEAVPTTASTETLRVEIPYDEVLYVVHDALGQLGLHKTLRTLEKESEKTFVNYNQDVLFLRNLILDGRYEETLEFLQPIMARLPKAKQVSMKRIIGIQHFLEMFVGEIGSTTVQSLIDSLKSLESVCSQTEFNELCYILTLEDLRDHPPYSNWTVDSGRNDCFQNLLPFMKDCLGHVGYPGFEHYEYSSGRLFSIMEADARELQRNFNIFDTKQALVYHPFDHRLEQGDNAVSRRKDVPAIQTNVSRHTPSVFHVIQQEETSELMQHQLMPEKSVQNMNPRYSIESASPDTLAQMRGSAHDGIRLSQTQRLSPFLRQSESKKGKARPRTAGEDIRRRYDKRDSREQDTEPVVVARLGGREATVSESQDIQNLLRRSLDINQIRSLQNNEKEVTNDARSDSSGKDAAEYQQEDETSPIENKKVPVAWEIPFFDDTNVKNAGNDDSGAPEEKERVDALPLKPTRNFNPTDVSRKRRVKGRPQTAPSIENRNRRERSWSPVRKQPSVDDAGPTEKLERPSLPDKKSTVRMQSSPHDNDEENKGDHQRLITPTSEETSNSGEETNNHDLQPTSGKTSYWRWKSPSNLSFSVSSTLSDVQPIRTLEFDGTGAFLAVGSNSKCLRITQVPVGVFDAATYFNYGGDYENYARGAKASTSNNKLRALETYNDFHLGSVYTVDWNNRPGITVPQGTLEQPAEGDTALLATGSNDTTVKVVKWKYQGMKPSRDLSSHSADILRNEDFDWLAGKASGEPSVKKPDGGTVRKVQFLTENCLATAGSGQGALCIFDMDSDMAEPLQRFYGHSGVVFSLQKWGLPEESAVFLTGGSDSTIRMWDLRTGTYPVMETQLHSVKNASGTKPEIHSLAANAYTIEKQRFAAGCSDGTVRLFDMRGQGGSDAESVAWTTLHTNECRSVDFSPDGTLLLSGAFDQSFAIWDTTVACQAGDEGNLKLVHHQRNAHSDKVLQVKWHPICPAIATSSADRSVRLWKGSFR